MVPGAEPDTPWVRAAGAPLAQLLAIGETLTHGGCRWRKGELGIAADAALEAAAWKVAEGGMQARCAGAAHAFEAWRKGATQQTAPSPSERSVLVAFIESGFGLPTAPRSEDHVQGHVAELVWYLVTLEQATGSRTLRRIERRASTSARLGGTASSCTSGTTAASSFDCGKSRSTLGRRAYRAPRTALIRVLLTSWW